nr:GntR family transcriptional regulator [Streptomyces tubercidicus]
MPELRRADAPYAQVAQHIREQIHGGQLAPGDRVPSIRDLAVEWGISKATADKALSALRAEGLLIAVSGIGTQVAPAVPTVQTGGDRVSRMLSTGRATRPGETSEILTSGLAPAPASAAQWLRIEEGTQAVRRQRLFRDGGDGRALTLSTSWLRAELADSVPGLLSTDRLEGGTIGAVRAATGRYQAMSQTVLTARLVTEEEAGALGLEQPAALLVQETRMADEDGDPLEFGEDLHAPSQSYAVGHDLSLL